jgi:hypothetical protein
MPWETFEQQEARARSRLRPMALVKAAMVAGLVVFVMPAGPWMSNESGIGSMGRVLSSNVAFAALYQAGLALAYGWVIAMVIYSMRLLPAMLIGPMIGAPLYALNYLVLGSGMGFDDNEVHVVMAHFSFALFFSAMYRAMAVPPPRMLQPLSPVNPAQNVPLKTQTIYSTPTSPAPQRPPL